jgi:hypothetical protein
VRGVGIELGGLLESSRYGRNARSEFIRWFPSSPWVGVVDRDPRLREQILEGRRDLLQLLLVGSAIPLLSSCALLPLIFDAINVAQKAYSVFEAAGGTALFSNNSQSREKAQLITTLFAGDSDEGSVEDELDFSVAVPSGEQNYVYGYEGLASEGAGDHVISGLALGETLLTEVFDVL